MGRYWLKDINYQLHDEHSLNIWSKVELLVNDRNIITWKVLREYISNITNTHVKGEGMEMIIKSIMVIILQYIFVSNHHKVFFNHLYCDMSTTAQ